MYILGISAFYHDAAAAICKDGVIIAAAQEERFTRVKHDESFPANSIQFCLDHVGITINELDAVVFYEKPFIKFERLLETYLAFAPRGIRSFIKAITVWSKKKLFIKKIIKDELKKINEGKHGSYKILFSEHHLSHAASAFYPSTFTEAAILVVDAVGEYATTSIFHATDTITLVKEMNFPHSVGLLYSAFTYYLGFTVNSGEYKLMGLAPYGNIDDAQTKQFIQTITEKLCKVYDDGSVFLDQQYFNYASGLTMVKDESWEKLFGFKKRNESDPIDSHHCNLAIAIQTVTEQIIVKLATEAKRLTGCENLCMAGGVALNCVANSKLLDQQLFKNIFIQPAAGDAGGAIGAALAGYHVYYEQPKLRLPCTGIYLGPAYSDAEIGKVLQKYQAHFMHHSPAELYDRVAQLINEGNVVGWFRNQMEFGPRALGNRSILADSRNPGMQQKLNLKIKFRESFRPFAPAVLAERAIDYFEMDHSSPYMLFVHKVKGFESSGTSRNEMLMQDKMKNISSPIPAVTHVDGTARVQTVCEKDNTDFYQLLKAFEKKTGCAVLINTSFNVRGEPIVCTPEDALRCFMNTGMDVLVLGDFILLKAEQQNMKPISYARGKLLTD